jgi:hypothetical protein
MRRDFLSKQGSNPNKTKEATINSDKMSDKALMPANCVPALT